jgi:putative DNA methylase
MAFYRRHLPHIDDAGRSVFLTWRLHDSLPPNRAFPEKSVTSGRAFVAMDRLLETARTGPVSLAQPPIARMVVESIYLSAEQLAHYELHAFVVMPNHVHMLITPKVALAKLTRCLKGITARRANQVLGLTGKPFWREESYDRTVRNRAEFEQIRRYIENNPFRAGLVGENHAFVYSSAAWGPLADLGVRPT